ncbi:hypothetical protein KCU59_g51, partial [Aureobasidium melanogenum]
LNGQILFSFSNHSDCTLFDHLKVPLYFTISFHLLTVGIPISLKFSLLLTRPASPLESVYSPIDASATLVSASAYRKNSRARVRRNSPAAQRTRQLEFEFCERLTQKVRESTKDYVDPFQEEVDPVLDGAPDYLSIIERPMSVRTIARKLEDKEYDEPDDVRRDFQLITTNCFQYNGKGSLVFRQGQAFQDAWNKLWLEKDDWVEAQASGHHMDTGTFSSDKADRNGDEQPNSTTENDGMEFSDMSDGDITSDEDLTSEYVDTLSEDTTEDHDSEGITAEHSEIPEEQVPEEDETSDDEPPRRPKPYALQADDLDEDAPLKKPVLKNRARKSRIPRLPFSRSDAANFLNANNKRPLDTNSTTETSAPSSSQQQNPVLERPAEEQMGTSTQDHESSAEQGPAKGPRLESSAESPSESPSQSPTQQQRAQQPKKDMVVEEIASHTTRITTNTEAEFDPHLYIWDSLRRNEQEAVLERVSRSGPLSKKWFQSNGRG